MATTRKKIPICHNHHLPEEIVGEEILTRLPVKSLVRFRSVCKTWKTLIASPNFIKSHLNCTFINPNNDSILVKRRRNPTQNQYEIASLSRMDSNLWDSHILYPIDCSSIQLLGSINGLVGLCRIEVLKKGLLGKPVIVRVWLWNPATKQCKAIQPLRNNYTVIPSVGFGFDSVANDFKFVCINGSHRALRSLQTLKCDVYSSKSNSWNNEIAGTDFSEVAETDFRPYYDTNRTIIVNGCPYWTVNRLSNFDYVVFFYKFEVRNEVFRSLPELHFPPDDQTTWRVVNFKDSLATLVYYSLGKGSSDRLVDDSLVDVYIFDERCELWCKAYTVGPLALELPMYRTSLWRCFKNGDIVFEDDDGNIVFLYEFKTKAIKGFRESRIPIRGNGIHYTESLVFVEGMELLREENKQSFPLKN